VSQNITSVLHWNLIWALTQVSEKCGYPVLHSGTLSKTINSTNNHCPFITLNINHCVQHYRHDVACCNGMWQIKLADPPSQKERSCYLYTGSQSHFLLLILSLEMPLNTRKHTVALTWYCCNHFADLKPIQNCGFAGTIKTEDEYSPFSWAKQTTEVAEEASYNAHTNLLSVCLLSVPSIWVPSTSLWNSVPHYKFGK